jgi:hypothetical protein
MGSPTTSMKLGSLQQLLSSTSLAKLENGVEAGIQILGDIKTSFDNAKSVPEIAHWIDSLDKLRSGAATQRTVVGVVRSTGAGKSSVINAVLDEECLVPTNCMRACTAVITELAYNNSDREDEKYRAEIHFISTDEWTKELRTMLDDMQTSQLSPENQSTDSDASIAYQKIRSAYPSLKSDQVKSGEIGAEELMQDPSINEVPGTVKQITSSTSKEFLGLLKKFIDSKEKTRGRKKEPDAMEYWPLIKLVKIFIRSPVLESGLVLVDLVSDFSSLLQSPSPNNLYSLAYTIQTLLGQLSLQSTLSSALDSGWWRQSLVRSTTRPPRHSLMPRSSVNFNLTGPTLGSR